MDNPLSLFSPETARWFAESVGRPTAVPPGCRGPASGSRARCSPASAGSATWPVASSRRA